MSVQTCGDPEVDQKVQEWLSWDRNEKTRDEIFKLVEGKNVAELKKRLCSRMEFGTAGLRAPMGAGYSQMNDLTLIQTTQGFGKYMLDTTPDVKKKGVVIGYDARHNSQRFAEITATVLLNLDIPVYLFSQICPTPYVAYGVLDLKCSWGIMVTASHNPKEDNGYKVYFENGAQIIPPHDKGIARSIEENLAPLATSWETSIVGSSPLRSDPFSRIHSRYGEDLKKLCCHRGDNANTPVKFTYTAMHGVGYQFVVEALKSFGFPPCIPVVEQVQPDPEFPTVKFPNPEEGKSALNLAMRTAEANDSPVILANDPDADRLAVAERLPSGSWQVFSGNEIGALLGWWWMRDIKSTQPGIPASDCYCLASSVSSKILNSIATWEGCNFVETLTGFKWMGNKAVDLMREGKNVLFAFEEAIGFMCGTTVLDKDGISAAMVVAEMVTHLYKRGTTLKQQLENIYTKYGHHVSSNSYFICHDREVTKRMFDRLRNYEGENQILPTSKSSQMITFTFANGCVATLRTSGTEPKIKYYTELCADPAKGESRETVEAELAKMVQGIINNFFEPKKNGLEARAS